MILTISSIKIENKSKIKKMKPLRLGHTYSCFAAQNLPHKTQPKNCHIFHVCHEIKLKFGIYTQK